MSAAISRKLAADEVSAFCYQIALMLSAGIGPSESVSLLAADASSPAEKEILGSLSEVLETGAPLSDALENIGCFPSHLVRMVSAGERAGRLDQTLSSLSDYYRREADFSAGVRRAVIYPSVMAAMVVAVLVLLVSQVLPAFRNVFYELGGGLSASAELMMGIGNICSVVIMVFGILVAIVLIAMIILFPTEKGRELVRRTCDLVFFRGKLGIANARARFAAVAAMLFESGLPTEDVLGYAAECADDKRFAEQVARSSERASTGESLPVAFAAEKVFSGSDTGLLSAGFRAGTPDRVLEELSRRNRDNADSLLERLVGKIEPALIILLSSAIGLILLAVMLPLLSLLV